VILESAVLSYLGLVEQLTGDPGVSCSVLATNGPHFFSPEELHSVSNLKLARRHVLMMIIFGERQVVSKLFSLSPPLPYPRTQSLCLPISFIHKQNAIKIIIQWI